MVAQCFLEFPIHSESSWQKLINAVHSFNALEIDSLDMIVILIATVLKSYYCSH